MTFSVDGAEMIGRAMLLRDGGSVIVETKIDGEVFFIRYAGSFGDALRGNDGMFEIAREGEQVGEFISREDISRLDDFIEHNRENFDETCYDVFMGKHKRTVEQIEQLKVERENRRQ